MSTDRLVAFVVFAFVSAVTPGPSNVILTATGAARGVLRGLPCLLGVATGMGVMVFLVAFGLGSLVLGNPALLMGLEVGGAGFLLWLAWKIATAKPATARDPGRAVGFWGAAAFQWVNPKAWLTSAGVVGAHLHDDAGGVLAQAARLGALFVAAALPGLLVWLGFGAAVRRLLRTERAARRFNVAMGLLLAGSLILFVR